MVTPTKDMKFILKILGRDLDLPNANEVENPVHGQKANNSRGQKVIYDETRGKWVMPQNFSGRDPVTVTDTDGFVYTAWAVYPPGDTSFSHPMTMAERIKIREAAKQAD